MIKKDNFADLEQIRLKHLEDKIIDALIEFDKDKEMQWISVRFEKILLETLLEAVEKQLNGGWISVKDRLPEESKAYLVQYNYGYKNSKDWCEVIHFQHNCKKWKRLNHLAIAWQPLPEMYEEN